MIYEVQSSWIHFTCITGSTSRYVQVGSSLRNRYMLAKYSIYLASSPYVYDPQARDKPDIFPSRTRSDKLTLASNKACRLLISTSGLIKFKLCLCRFASQYWW
jgi:hypothetical protein